MASNIRDMLEVTSDLDYIVIENWEQLPYFVVDDKPLRILCKDSLKFSSAIKSKRSANRSNANEHVVHFADDSIFTLEIFESGCGLFPQQYETKLFENSEIHSPSGAKIPDDQSSLQICLYMMIHRKGRELSKHERHIIKSYVDTKIGPLINGDYDLT